MLDKEKETVLKLCFIETSQDQTTVSDPGLLKKKTTLKKPIF